MAVAVQVRRHVTDARVKVEVKEGSLCPCGGVLALLSSSLFKVGDQPLHERDRLADPRDETPVDVLRTRVDHRRPVPDL